MLEPIYRLLFGQAIDGRRVYFLALAQNQVKTFYKTYKSNNVSDMQEIIDKKLAPGREP